ncbi:MAG: hypothetical protein U0W24_21810 [Bacteroidales bacterium]
MAKIYGLIAAIVVFLIWRSLIGNPHVIETILGVIFAAIAGFWVYSKANKLRSND